ncbi:MAG: hypothetical protein ABS62_11010 [Microbacterium sp. SCN 70-200]|uniref:Uncharacterized protein n=2 Tax=Microbacteriaceae TaxID=85023 RepID=A0A542YJM7_9MICO|nr:MULTISPECIES: hypothetical protein [Microbacteriaceae]MBN9215866.1 hypothetical protein [Microbacterium sp.]ODT40224.1 MAG: hypothetical protein ABS62_11010 [Microbacterium sp. SCN 70-200]OJV82571.1 MAG: hypothetical protein BGO46_00375 [Microbacterium sp. 70-16]TQL48297.1 hypothetical protein FB562_1386 [Homoserinimonas aerilata]WEG10020.1 hypothetical protein PU630_05555 [Microbacterium sp. KACC 23027]
MTHNGPFNEAPIACTLPTIAEAKAQVEKWQAFDADYAQSSERTDTQLTVHYAKVEDSILRLRDLVAVERRCCAFVDWSTEESDEELRLIARGTSDQLAALNIGHG